MNTISVHLSALEAGEVEEGEVTLLKKTFGSSAKRLIYAIKDLHLTTAFRTFMIRCYGAKRQVRRAPPSQIELLLQGPLKQKDTL